jgi:hypothetical protein
MRRQATIPISKQSLPATQLKLGPPPAVTEFQNACKFAGFTNDEVISRLSVEIAQSDGEIRFVNKTFGPQFTKIFMRYFSRFQRIPRLSFYSCYFQDPTFYTRFATDLGKTSITQLKLDFAPIPRDLLSPFFLTNLDFLSLRGVQCITTYDFVTGEPGVFTESANVFYRNFSCSKLKALDLSGCHIGNDGARAIASVLLFAESLRCLNLTRNRIGDPGATALALALSSYRLTPQEIEFHGHVAYEESKQKISDEGGGLLKGRKGKKTPRKTAAPGQKKKSPPTKSLNPRTLSFDPNAPVSAPVLAKWHSVVGVSDDARALPGNGTLTTLILDDNAITGIGLTALAEMLRVNQRIVTFSVTGNPDLSAAEVTAVTRTYVAGQPTVT